MIKRDAERAGFVFVIVWLTKRLLQWIACFDNGERYMTSLGTPRAKFHNNYKRLRDDIQS
jgi:hypothetical protein